MTGVIGRVAQSRGIRQLVKFCIVGVSSLTIDLIVFNLLLDHVAPIWALSAAFVAGVSNSFFWNSRWTFAGNERNLKRQLPIFFGTNLVGFLLNTAITSGVLVLAAQWRLMDTNYPPMETLRLVFFRDTNSVGFSRLALNAAKLCAAVVVVAWNFTASKFITFRHAGADPASATDEELMQEND
ncbi:MAG: GtrA family protein [Armatimonadetes bacterium]|nr:GtrA family protein [Armatimonadota bacterium]